MGVEGVELDVVEELAAFQMIPNPSGLLAVGLAHNNVRESAGWPAFSANVLALLCHAVQETSPLLGIRELQNHGPFVTRAFQISLSAASQSIIPEPTQVGAAPMSRQVRRIISATSDGVKASSRESSRAARPATWGQAPLVPHHLMSR